MLKPLELKISPPIIAMLSAGLIWQLNQIFPKAHFHFAGLRGLSITSASLGVLLGAVAIIQFKHMRTTIHPDRPQQTRLLVMHGIYRFSRNPMYLGIFFFLLGWVLWLANFAGALGLLFFVVYLTHFQIKPEERILAQKFGASYQHYTQTVRRWL